MYVFVSNTSRPPPILGVNKVVPPVAPIEKQEHERECKSGDENYDHESIRNIASAKFSNYEQSKRQTSVPTYLQLTSMATAAFTSHL